MLCKNCNKEFSTSERFCTTCGSALEETTVVEVIKAEPQVTAADLVRKFCTSKLYLVATIVFTISILATIVSFVLRAMNLANLIQYAGMFSYTQTFIQPIVEQFSIIITTAVSQIGAWITALGLWMHYRACRKPEPTSTVGLTVLKIMQILTAITMIVATLFIFVVLFFILMFNLVHPEEFLIMVIVFIVCGVIVLPFLVLAEIYYFKNVSAINKTKKMLKKNELCKMPLYSIVYNFISVGIGLCGILTILLTENNSVFYIIGALAMLASTLLYTVLMLRFNAAVKKTSAAPQPAQASPSPSEAAAALILQDAEEIIDAQVDNEETIEDMPQA